MSIPVWWQPWRAPIVPARASRRYFLIFSETSLMSVFLRQWCEWDSTTAQLALSLSVAPVIQFVVNPATTRGCRRKRVFAGRPARVRPGPAAVAVFVQKPVFAGASLQPRAPPTLRQHAAIYTLYVYTMYIYKYIYIYSGGSLIGQMFN